MGQGLTIANNTWYHVFAIFNGATDDVYFDTSISAANHPPGYTAFRRLGSFLTDGSAHIIPFVQSGDRFDWLTPVSTGTLSPASTTAQDATLTSGTPPGVAVEAILSGLATHSTSANTIPSRAAQTQT